MNWLGGLLSKALTVVFSVIVLSLVASSGTVFAESASDTPRSLPDRYLFDRASEVYQVFKQVRKAPRTAAHTPTRSLASLAPILSYPSTFSPKDDSLVSKIQAAIGGVVLTSDIQLPNDSSHGTQDSSKIQ